MTPTLILVQADDVIPCNTSDGFDSRPYLALIKDRWSIVHIENWHDRDTIVAKEAKFQCCIGMSFTFNQLTLYRLLC